MVGKAHQEPAENGGSSWNSTTPYTQFYAFSDCLSVRIGICRERVTHRHGCFFKNRRHSLLPHSCIPPLPFRLGGCMLQGATFQMEANLPFLHFPVQRAAYVRAKDVE